MLRRSLKAVIGPFAWIACLVIPPPSPAADIGALLSQARAQREAGNLEEAVASFERLLASAQEGKPSEKELATLHRELGEIYAALGRPYDAVGEYGKSLSANPKQRVLHYRTGILYRELAEHSKAASHLSEALRLGFRNTAVRFHLAAAQFASGQFTAGLDNSREILRQSAPSGNSALRVGRLLFQYHFYRDAVPAFEMALARSEDSFEARVYLALTSHLLNRYQRTVELLSPLRAPDGSANAEVLTLLAAALAALGRFDEAEALLGRAIADQPSSPHAYMNLALVLLEQGEIEAAESWFRKMLLSAGPTSPKVFYAVRRNSCDQTYQEIAGRPVDDGIGKNPEQGLRFFEFAINFGARHHHGTAVELLRIAARDTAEHELSRARLLRAVGFSCLNLEPGSETPVRLLERSIELAADDHQAHFLLGSAHLKRNQTEQAAEAFRRAIELRPDAVAYYTELARALVSGPNGVEAAARAATVLVKAIKIDPTNASALFELGKLRMGQGRLAEAEERLRQAIEAEPEFYEAYYVLGRLYARAKKPEQAREYLSVFETKKAAIEARSTVWKDATVGIAAE